MWMFAVMLIKCWYYLGHKADVIYSFRSWRETFKNHSLTWSVYSCIYTGERYICILGLCIRAYVISKGSCIRAYVITLGSCMCVYVLTFYTVCNITDIYLHPNHSPIWTC